MYEKAMEWLDQKFEESDYIEEDHIIKWIKEMLSQYNDLKNS